MKDKTTVELTNFFTAIVKKKFSSDVHFFSTPFPPLCIVTAVLSNDKKQ